MRLQAYNPNASPITVYVETITARYSLTVPAGGVSTHTYTAGTGLVEASLIYSANEEVFYSIFAMDADASHTAYDWGSAPIAIPDLTDTVVVGWGYGTSDLTTPLGPGSPVWLTADSDTTLVWMSMVHSFCA